MQGNPLVPFLRSYGPIAASDCLYDEHVQSATREFGVEEVRMSAPLVGELGALLAGASPINVILTGTAGDGKTYHIRRVFLEHLGGRPEDWPGNELVVRAPLPDGRELRVIRDLSELAPARKAEEIDHITRCLAGEDDRTLYLVAANDGQLLEMWRIASAGEDPETSLHGRVYRALSAMLRHEDEEDPTGFLKVRMYNLSRRIQANAVDEAIDGVLGHRRWETGCDACQLGEGKETCPIRVNRRLLLGDPAVPDSQVFRARLREAVALAAANDQHVPIRQVLTLVVNILLGDLGNPDAPLLTCKVACKRAKARQYRKTNPYDNAVGANLAEDARSRYSVFSALETFGIGLETTNPVDELLLRRRPATLADRLDRMDPVYGDALFGNLRARYLNGPRERLDFGAFSREMASQRRRLFFQLPADAAEAVGEPWMLTIFHKGGLYLAFRDQVANRGSHPVIDQVTRAMVKGFNRALTGMMTDDTETLWLAGTIGRSDDPTGRVATTEGIRRTRGTGLLHLQFEHDPKRSRPRIRIGSLTLGVSVGHLPQLDVRPLLFEYLLRVAEGSLPSSFSRQCHQEVKHFAMMLRQQVGQIFGANVPSLPQVQILSLDGDSSIKRNEIKVMLP